MFMGNGMRRYADADLHLLERLLVAQVDARKGFRRGRVQAILPRFHVLEVLGYQFDETVVVEVPSGGDNEITGGEVVS